MPDGIQQRISGSWHSSVTRAVLEAHFGRGLLAVADRRPNFARTYDLAERILAGEHHGRQVKREDAQRELLRVAAAACGIAAATDLADYFRMPVREARPRIAELVEAGELSEVKVEGWREPGYLHRAVQLPRKIEARALLSPFDPVIWYRPRALRLFHFDYRVEIFVPQPKRKWGYYVLPFLLDDRLVARVDLKADRSAPPAGAFRSSRVTRRSRNRRRPARRRAAFAGRLAATRRGGCRTPGDIRALPGRSLHENDERQPLR